MARIAAAGRNCWKVARAGRVAFLVDADAYFRAVAASLRRAERSVLILGWDIHSRTPLLPERGHDGELARILGAATRRNPSLRVRILSWDPAPIFAMEREFAPLLKFEWKTRRRV